MSTYCLKTSLLQTYFSRPDTRRRRFLLSLKGTLLPACVALACLLPGMARSQIYVSDYSNGTVGEYALDGTAINTSLISIYAQALTTSGNDLFVANPSAVNEYTLSGGVVSSTSTSGVGVSYSVVVSGGDIFVAGYGTGNIGEYTLSGTPINTQLFTQQELEGNPQSIAVSGNDIYVTTVGGFGVNEYTLGGSHVSNLGFSGVNEATYLALSGNDLYVLNGSGSIGEYTLDGGVVNANLVMGLDNAESFAVSDDDIYVGNANGTIAEYALDGTLVNPDLISTGLPIALAVVVPEPSVLALGGLGAAGLFLFRQLKRKNPAPGRWS